MTRFKNLSTGFTLIELLIVIGLIGGVGAILVNTILSTLRGSNKGAISSTIRSEGSYVMQNMVRDIQEADSFQGASLNNVAYTKPCPVSGSPAYRYIKINGSSLVSCPVGAAMGSFSSINTEVVSVAACSIRCTQASSIDNPTFVIDFTLTQSSTGKSAGGLFENRASVDFSTTVRMRNPVQ